MASKRGLSSIEHYVLALIDEDEGRADHDRLDALLIEGLESGGSIEATPEFWEEHKRRFLVRHPEAAPYV